MPEPTIENIIRFGFYKMRMITKEEYNNTAAIYISRDTGYGIETDGGEFDVLVLNQYEGYNVEHLNKTYAYMFKHKDEYGLKDLWFYIIKI